MIVVRHNPVFGNEVMMVRGSAVEYIRIPAPTTMIYRKHMSHAFRRSYNIRPSEHPNPMDSAAVVI